MTEAALAEVVAAERPLVWALSYRMLGVAQDADEVAQDTFLRLVEAPPADLSRPLRPWLVRVACNLSRDRLRRRRRMPYPGVWLPSPTADDDPGPEHRALSRESASFAWLLALERLRPSQRLVFVLREVLELSVTETAEALGMSEGNVKITLHRAHRALAAPVAPEAAPLPAGGPGAGPESGGAGAAPEVAWAVWGRFLGALAAGDVGTLRELLAPDVVSVSDGAGRHAAARRPVRGARKVAAFYLAISRRDGMPPRWRLGSYAGLPGLLCELDRPPGRWSPRFAWCADIRADGRIHGLYAVVAPEKLGALPALSGGAPAAVTSTLPGG